MPRRLLSWSLAALALAGCATESAEPLLGGDEKADGLSQSVCGTTVGELQRTGVGEVGEVDLDPRLTANRRAQELNAGIDCQSQSDRCLVPRYLLNEDTGKAVVELANSEVVAARLLFDLDTLELIAEETPLGCVSNEPVEEPSDEEVTAHERMRVLGILLADASVREQIFADGFDFLSMVVEEVDDGGTEPFYHIKVGRMNDAFEFETRCFGLQFDTDDGAFGTNTQVSLEEGDCGL